MDVETQKKIDEIWSILHASAVRGTEMERRLNAAHDKAMARMDRAEARMDRMERESKARMDKFEKGLDGLRKIVVHGMKMLVRIEQTQKQLITDTQDLKRSQKAFLDSLRNGGNGNGRKHS